LDAHTLAVVGSLDDFKDSIVVDAVSVSAGEVYVCDLNGEIRVFQGRSRYYPLTASFSFMYLLD